jgi:hypothetical protein
MKAPKWQIDRVSLIHREFEALHHAVETERAPITAGLHAIADRLDGTEIRDHQGKVRLLRAKYATLRRLWDEWRRKGRTAACLLPNYRTPAHVHKMPDALVREIQRLATMPDGARDKHGKGRDGTTIHKSLAKRWRAGREVPGVGTWQDWWRAAHPALPLPDRAPDFPWCERTVQRHVGSRQIRTLGNVGPSAGFKHGPHMERDYSKLRKCELYTLDDVQADLYAIDDITGRVVAVTLYILQEVASRMVAGFVLKPADSIKAEDVDELIAYALQSFGVGVGYTTHIWFERGTVACSEAAQVVLEAMSEGAIKIHRTSMDGGVRWVGAAADKAIGHSAGKATIESFNRKLHNMLIDLPGQRGNRYDQQPQNLGGGEREVKDPSKGAKNTLLAEAERLGQMRATILLKGGKADFKLPLLLVSDLQRKVTAAVEAYNDDRGHGMQGFHLLPEAEIAPGIWEPVGEPARL